MNLSFSSRGLFAIGFAILVATNVFVLAGVKVNRSGQPDTLITLSERELRLPYRVLKENSGLTLDLKWRALAGETEYSAAWNSPAWFDAAKLAELGFDLDATRDMQGDAAFAKRPLPKEVFIVLEYDGEQYREAIRKAETALAKEERLFKANSSDQRLRNLFERAQERAKAERTTESRLFAVDAGVDRKMLRQKYADRSRFLIAKGVVEPNFDHQGTKTIATGYITALSVERIHVPLKHRQIFETILSRGKATPPEFAAPRYQVELAYGTRLEPWIVSVAPLERPAEHQPESRPGINEAIP